MAEGTECPHASFAKEACLQAKGHPVSACAQPFALPVSGRDHWVLRLPQCPWPAVLPEISPRSEGPDITLAGTGTRAPFLGFSVPAFHTLCHIHRHRLWSGLFTQWSQALGIPSRISVASIFCSVTFLFMILSYLRSFSNKKQTWNTYTPSPRIPTLKYPVILSLL